MFVAARVEGLCVTHQSIRSHGLGGSHIPPDFCLFLPVLCILDISSSSGSITTTRGVATLSYPTTIS